MELIRKTVQLKGTGIQNGIRLYGFGDIHRDDAGFYKEGFEEFISALSKDSRGFGIAIGDWFSFMRQKDRVNMASAMKLATEETQTVLDELFDARVQGFLPELEPIRNKVLASVGGNHTYQFANGRYMDEDVSDYLGARYVDGAALIQIDLKLPDLGDKKRTIIPATVFCHHGWGGGRTEGGDVTQIVNQILPSYEGVDIFMLGHTHQLYTKLSTQRLTIRSGRIKSVNRYIARTGSFSRAYMEGTRRVSYGEKRGYKPTALGYVVFHLWVDEKRELNIRGYEVPLG